MGAPAGGWRVSRSNAAAKAAGSDAARGLFTSETCEVAGEDDERPRMVGGKKGEIRYPCERTAMMWNGV